MPVAREKTELPLKNGKPAEDDKYGKKMKTQPHRWYSFEMGVFYIVLVFGFLTPLVMFSPVAREYCNNHPECKRHLRKGWIQSLPVDLADNQWRQFRENIPTLLVVSLGYLIISRSVRSFRSSKAQLVWYCVSSCAYVWLLSGTGGSIMIFGIASANFFIGKMLGGSRWNPIATWVFGVAMMVLQEFYREYLTLGYLLGPSYRIYDRNGILGVHFSMYMRMVFLKMVSFNVDYYWSEVGTSGTASSWHLRQLERFSEQERDDIAKGGGPYSWREKTARPPSDYNVMAYVAFLFYIPLMLTGPIMPFNAFVSYVHKEQKTFSARGMAVYIARLLFAFLLLEVFAHYFPVIAICTSGAYKAMPPIQLAALVYITLKTMWLKFLVLWRFFRTWALLDGVEPVENMNRCMSNNWTLQGFWKSWHRSFNRWLVRYIYIPLGGSQYKYITVFVVFTFVALWHDMNMKLLAWGWITGLTFLPEMLITVMFRKISTLRALLQASYFRFIVAIGGAANILLLMVANMVGYSVGISGTGSIASSITWGNALVAMYVVSCLFLGVLFMQEWREEEKRRGILKAF